MSKYSLNICIINLKLNNVCFSKHYVFFYGGILCTKVAINWKEGRGEGRREGGERKEVGREERRERGRKKQKKKEKHREKGSRERKDEKRSIAN